MKCPRCSKKIASVTAHRSRCAASVKISKKSGRRNPHLKKTYTEAELNEVAVPPPYAGRKAKIPSLVPDYSKWECFECGKVIGEKKICPHCNYDTRE
jgi:hypothetical protein